MPHLTVFGVITLVAGLIAAGILIHHMVARPSLSATVRLRLLLGLGVFPAVAAIGSTGYGMERTTERQFCGSCHVMETHLEDVENPLSLGLASRHARTPHIGPNACYICHADYGMLGYPLTKINGMSHVWHYYVGGYRSWPLAKFHAEVRTARPYPNTNCRQCHSGALSSFVNVREHAALAVELEKNTVSCASAGCHGMAHPFSKRPDELEGDRR